MSTRLRDQLRDPIFRKWFATPPKLRADHGVTPAWRVYVQREPNGPWARADVKTWREGYDYVQRNINKVYDIALTHKRQGFKPPVVRDKTTDRKRYYFPPAFNEHQALWCPFCRQVTIFRYFGRHHAWPKWMKNLDARCCHICGVRLQFAQSNY